MLFRQKVQISEWKIINYKYVITLNFKIVRTSFKLFYALGRFWDREHKPLGYDFSLCSKFDLRFSDEETVIIQNVISSVDRMIMLPKTDFDIIYTAIVYFINMTSAKKLDAMARGVSIRKTIKGKFQGIRTGSFGNLVIFFNRVEFFWNLFLLCSKMRRW